MSRPETASSSATLQDRENRPLPPSLEKLRIIAETLSDPYFHLYCCTRGFDSDDVLGSRARALASFNRLMTRYGVALDIAEETRTRVVTMFDHWKHPEQVKKSQLYGDRAFLVHERGEGFADIDNALPALAGLPEEEKAILFKQLPRAFNVGFNYDLADKEKQQPIGSVVSLAVTVKAMEWEAVRGVLQSCGRKKEWQCIREYLNKHIFAAVKKCPEWGIHLAGLSETMGSAVSNGKLLIAELKRLFGDNYQEQLIFTTGHRFTLVAIEGTMIKSLREVFGRPVTREDLAQLSITVLGGMGAIGIAWAKLAAHMGFSRIVLEDLDRPEKRAAAVRLEKELKGINPDIQVVKFFAKNSRDRQTLKDACAGSHILGTASANTRPIFTTQEDALILADMIHIEDSQPPAIAEQLVRQFGLAVAHALAPAFSARTFNTGLSKGYDGLERCLDWGCNAELHQIALWEARGRNPAELATTQPVTYEMSQDTLRAAIDLGLLFPDFSDWPDLESFGVPVPRERYAALGRKWGVRKAA